MGNLLVAGKGLETGELTNINQKRELFDKIKTEEDISKKCSMLLDVLFDNEKDKDIYLQRFNANIALQYGIGDFEKLHLSINNRGLEDNDDRSEI